MEGDAGLWNIELDSIGKDNSSPLVQGQFLLTRGGFRGDGGGRWAVVQAMQPGLHAEHLGSGEMGDETGKRCSEWEAVGL